MLSPRLTNCPECANIPSLLKKIDCRLAELGNNLYNNISYMLNKPVPSSDILQLIGYRRILMYKYCNPSYVEKYSVQMIASRVIRLTAGCVSKCNELERCLEEPCDIKIVPNPTTTSTSTLPPSTTTTSTTVIPTTTTTSSSSTSTTTSTSSSTSTTTSTTTVVSTQWIIFASFNPYSACQQIDGENVTVYTSTPFLGNGVTLYLDAGLTIPYVSNPSTSNVLSDGTNQYFLGDTGGAVIVFSGSCAPFVPTTTSTTTTDPFFYYSANQYKCPDCNTVIGTNVGIKTISPLSIGDFVPHILSGELYIFQALSTISPEYMATLVDAGGASSTCICPATTTTTTTIPFCVTECLPLFSKGTGVFIYKNFSITDLTSQITGPIPVTGDVANTSNKLWLYGQTDISEYDINGFCPFSATYNKNINLASGFFGSGMTAIDDVTLVSSIGNNIVQVDVATTTAGITVKFPMPTNRDISGDLIYTTANQLVCSYVDNITSNTYITIHNYSTGAILVDINISSVIYPWGLYIDAGVIHVCDNNGQIFSLNLDTEVLTLVENVGQSLNGASQAPECAILNPITTTTTTTVEPTTTTTTTLVGCTSYDFFSVVGDTHTIEYIVCGGVSPTTLDIEPGGGGVNACVASIISDNYPAATNDVGPCSISTTTTTTTV